MDRKIILKWMLRKWGIEGVNWIHMAQDNSHWLNDYELLKKDSAPWS
jgi:hypothetical protein